MWKLLQQILPQPKTSAMVYKTASTTSIRGLAAIASYEGVALGPYYDSQKVLTCYIGHTKAAGFPNPATLARGTPLDRDSALKTAFSVFKTDIEKYEQQVRSAITVSVSQSEFDAAVSFHYNTGAISTATWVKTLNTGDHVTAAEQILNWMKNKELVTRRTNEYNMFKTGAYPTNGTTVYSVDNNYRLLYKNTQALSYDKVLTYLE